MPQRSIRETIKEHFWAICFVVATIGFLLAERLGPPQASALEQVTGRLERVVPVRFGNTSRLGARLDLRRDDTSAPTSVYVAERAVRGHSEPGRSPYHRFQSSIGQTVQVRLTPGESSGPRMVFEARTSDTVLLSLADTTMLEQIRGKVLTSGSALIVLAGFFSMHHRFGSFRKRRSQPASDFVQLTRIAGRRA
jgi:hypothetical protein